MNLLKWQQELKKIQLVQFYRRVRNILHIFFEMKPKIEEEGQII